MKYFALIILCYFMGSIPSGVWLGKYLKHIDVRDYGSKNSGATNCYRVMGPKIGAAVLCADILKGFIPMLIAHLAGASFNFMIFLGLIVILAHTYSCFISFKGGKGVATTVGVLLFLEPVVLITLIFVFFAVFFTTRYVSLASITAAAALPVLMIFLGKHDSIPMFIFSLVIAAFVIYRHKTNITRLLNRTENKFKF